MYIKAKTLIRSLVSSLNVYYAISFRRDFSTAKRSRESIGLTSRSACNSVYKPLPVNPKGSIKHHYKTSVTQQEWLNSNHITYCEKDGT